MRVPSLTGASSADSSLLSHQLVGFTQSGVELQAVNNRQQADMPNHPASENLRFFRFADETAESQEQLSGCFR
jgi:hypothetical protein